MKESLEADATNNITLKRIRKKIFRPSDRIRASALDKVMYFSQLYHDGQCRCIIRFDGRINISLLTRAVELSLIAAPILGYRYVYHPWQSFWEKGSLSGAGIPLRYSETLDEAEELARFLTEPIEAKQGIQVLVCLIRSGCDTLCIKLSHMVADAMGLMDYISILSQLYNKLQVSPDYVPQKPAKCVRGLSQVLRYVRIPVLVKGFYKWKYPKSQWGFPKVKSDFSSGAFPVRLVSRERVSSIKTFCHEKEIKITDVITAVFYQALIDTLKPRPDSLLPIQMTMDLRPYLPSGSSRTVCNLTGTYYPVIIYSKGKSFEETLQDVVKAVKEERDCKSWFGGVIFIEVLTLLPGFVQTLLSRRIIKHELSRGTSHPYFSNLGVIDSSVIDFGNLKVDDLGLYGPVSFPPNFLVTVYSFHGKMYINSSFCPTAVDPHLVDRFFDSFLNYLPK